LQTGRIGTAQVIPLSLFLNLMIVLGTLAPDGAKNILAPDGEFNVPFGKIESPAIPSYKDLKDVSKLLANIKILSSTYQSVLKKARKGNFIYLDPPYPPLNKTSFSTTTQKTYSG
jgi:hypothetical protein